MSFEVEPRAALEALAAWRRRRKTTKSSNSIKITPAATAAAMATMLDEPELAEAAVRRAMSCGRNEEMGGARSVCMQMAGRSCQTWRRVVALVRNVGSNGIAGQQEHEASAVRQVNVSADSKFHAKKGSSSNLLKTSSNCSNKLEN